MDTAFGYGNGQSEERVGKVMKDRRKGMFLATKINKRKGDEAMKVLEGTAEAPADGPGRSDPHPRPQGRGRSGGGRGQGRLAPVLLKMRDQKVTRFIGVTSHTDPEVLKMALERHDFDCTQMALNAALVGMKSGPRA